MVDAVAEQPQTETNADAAAIKARVERVMALGEAARSSQSEFDLATAQFELGQDMMSASEVGVLLAYINGHIDEKRAGELLTAAQTQQDAEKLVEAAKANGNLDDKQVAAINEGAAKQPESVEAAKAKQAEAIVEEAGKHANAVPAPTEGTQAEKLEQRDAARAAAPAGGRA